jgi:hypothetical protein
VKKDVELVDDIGCVSGDLCRFSRTSQKHESGKTQIAEWDRLHFIFSCIGACSAVMPPINYLHIILGLSVYT